MGNLKDIALPDRDRLPQGDGLAVHGGLHVRPGQADDRVDPEFRFEIAPCYFEARFARNISHEQVGKAQGNIVEGPGRRHPVVQITNPSRPVFNDRLNSTIDDFQHGSTLPNPANPIKMRSQQKMETKNHGIILPLHPFTMSLTLWAPASFPSPVWPAEL